MKNKPPIASLVIGDTKDQGTTEWLSLRGRDTVMTNSCVMQREATHVQSIPRFKQSTVQQELSAEAIQCIHIHKEIKKKESKKEKGEEFWKDHFVHLDDHNKML